MNHGTKIGLLFLALMLSSPSSRAQIVPYDSDLIERQFVDKIQAHRNIEEKSFRNEETSLLSVEYFPRFTGLNYFPADLKYRVMGTLVPLSGTERAELEMSDGGSYGFVRYGKVSFSLDGKAIDLQVFEYPSRNPDVKAVFIPFRDKTTGKESYGGGRFLVVHIPKSEQLVLDFNLAINPICVYDPDHACPVPPPSNRMPVRVSAGARMYDDPGESASDS